LKVNPIAVKVDDSHLEAAVMLDRRAFPAFDRLVLGLHPCGIG